MKKLLLNLSILLLLSSCVRTKEPLLITSVSTSADNQKYRIVVNDDIMFYSTTLYQVGDTLK